ncbi:hypothetical protein PoB_002760100 [Plakobranchus ocellatus]|uniref:Uncharacterized protein n=1 Tax=Plakobranchus ocellatus TaxID=259542 RepID=A0AAV4A331_9GAST|nr:hypothetical protein PoB_002760100 [Plakobranchus ocellatus]
MEPRYACNCMTHRRNISNMVVAVLTVILSAAKRFRSGAWEPILRDGHRPFLERPSYTMSKLQVSILVALLCLFLACLVQSASLPDSHASSRNKRQSADVRTAEYLAWIALGGRLPGESHECNKVACGLVDIYRSSPNQAPLQQPVIDKGKARGTSWAVIKESMVLFYSLDKKTGHARTPYLRFLASSSLSGGNPHDVITLPLVFRCAVNGNPLESGNYSFA